MSTPTEPPSLHRFDAVLRAGPRGGAFVSVPFDVEATWGARRVPVRALFDGSAEYRGTVVFMDGGPILGVTREVRNALGKEVGDSVQVEVARDDAPRTVEVPRDLVVALRARPELAEHFESLAYTHRKEYARWVAEAKRPETRARRVARALEMLADSLPS